MQPFCSDVQRGMLQCLWHVAARGRMLCRSWDDASVSPVVRQSMLHWAYELTEADFEALRKGV